jgi:twitching motility protein PilI
MQAAADTRHDSLFQRLRKYEAIALAYQPGIGEDSENRWDGVAFRLDELRLCIDVARVDEIVSPPPLTSVPGSVGWLLGLTNVRGNLVTVIDLRAFYRGERAPLTSRSQVLVVQADNQHLGFLVDEILGQRHFDTTQAAPAGEGTEGLHVHVQHHQDGVDWGILDLQALLQDDRFQDGAA